MLDGKKWNIKYILKEVLVWLVILFVVSNVVSYLRKPTLDSNQLPEISVKLIDGTMFQNVKNKPLLVHFWATWCPTCKLEAPNIERLSTRYTVITFVVKSGSDDELQNYMLEKDYHFSVVNDKEGKWAKRFKVEAFPTTFIYDSQQSLKFTEVGYSTTAGLLARMKLAE